MNIWFDKIRWRNLLSTGNQFTEIDFNASKMSLIVGQNGAGKSTLLDALTFALFGKPFRDVNKPQLINTITKKELLVEIEFRIKGVKWRVTRGLKPAVFEIWRDDELLNQDAKAKDYQAYLEKQILRTNIKTFCQIVILGSANFVPFMQLRSHERRAITEDVLDLQIFTSMNNILKAKVTSAERELADKKTRMAILSEKLKDAHVHATQIIDDKVKQLAEKNKTIGQQQFIIDASRTEIDAKTREVSMIALGLTEAPSTEKRAKKLGTLRSQLLGRVSALSSDLKFLTDHENCPTCHQVIDGEFREKTTCDKRSTIQEIESGLKQLEEQYEEIDQRLKEFAEMNSQISSLNIETYVLNTKIDGAIVSIKRLERERAALEEDMKTLTAESDLSKIELDLKDVVRSHDQLVNDVYMMEYISILLKDTGIKSRIIKQYIPVINKLINKYCAALEFFVDFELNESFEETIKSRGRDNFSYNSFSEGEKMRIDLAVLFAWRAVAKLRSSINTNLLIMDEVFDSSLDSSGNEEFMKILSKVTEDNNVLIISHKTDQLGDKFERVIKFEKVKNFSRIVA